MADPMISAHLPQWDSLLMPRPSKTQTQSNLIYTAEALLAASIVLEDDPETEEMALFGAYDADFLADNTSDLLEITALNWIEIAH
jgi:hypothetical protein